MRLSVQLHPVSYFGIHHFSLVRHHPGAGFVEVLAEGFVFQSQTAKEPLSQRVHDNREHHTFTQLRSQV